MATEDAKQRWLPLESNPEVMNRFIWDLGASQDYEFVDVFGLDEEFLAMVPQPALAALLLFPVSPATEQARHDENARLSSAEQQLPASTVFVKQTISNACGTIGLVHAACNNADVLGLDDDSFFGRLVKLSRGGASPNDLAKVIETDKTIGDTHSTLAQEGQTAPPQLDEVVDLHFVCFTVVDGRLLELDGRKAFPIDHGPCTSDDFLAGVARRVHAFIALDPDNVNFNLVALTKKGQDD